MTFFNIIVGIITVLTFIFMLFPHFLNQVLKVDPYKLGVLCVLIVCVIYWIYLVITTIGRRSKQRKLKELEEYIRKAKLPQELKVQITNCMQGYSLTYTDQTPSKVSAGKENLTKNE